MDGRHGRGPESILLNSELFCGVSVVLVFGLDTAVGALYLLGLFLSCGRANSRCLNLQGWGAN